LQGLLFEDSGSVASGEPEAQRVSAGVIALEGRQSGRKV
jgi:hypothetical protein